MKALTWYHMVLIIWRFFFHFCSCQSFFRLLLNDYILIKHSTNYCCTIHTLEKSFDFHVWKGQNREKNFFNRFETDVVNPTRPNKHMSKCVAQQQSLISTKQKTTEWIMYRTTVLQRQESRGKVLKDLCSVWHQINLIKEHLQLYTNLDFF